MKIGLQIPNLTWGAGPAIGVDHAIFNMPNVQDITPIEIFGREVIPEVAAL